MAATRKTKKATTRSKPPPSPIDRIGWSGKSRNVRLVVPPAATKEPWKEWEGPYTKPLTSADQVEDHEDRHDDKEAATRSPAED